MPKKVGVAAVLPLSAARSLRRRWCKGLQRRRLKKNEEEKEKNLLLYVFCLVVVGSACAGKTRQKVARQESRITEKWPLANLHPWKQPIFKEPRSERPITCYVFSRAKQTNQNPFLVFSSRIRLGSHLRMKNAEKGKKQKREKRRAMTEV